MFKHQAQQHGAELVCLKKVHQFQQWLATAKKPYVLFTDWREAKQCNEAITVQGLDYRPIFTSIFCVDGKQKRRAERWVKNLPERNYPMYTKTNRELPSAVSTVDRLLLGSSPPSLLTQLMNDDLRSSCIVEGAQPARSKESPLGFDLTKPMKDGMCTLRRNEPTLLAKNNVPELPLPEVTWPKNGEQAHCVSQRSHLRRDDGATLPYAPWPSQPKDKEVQVLQKYENKPTTAAIPAVAHADPQMAVLHWSVAAHVTQIWESFSCSEEVEKALLAAMPETYED
jgi:hypothetical protein